MTHSKELTVLVQFGPWTSQTIDGYSFLNFSALVRETLVEHSPSWTELAQVDKKSEFVSLLYMHHYIERSVHYVALANGQTTPMPQLLWS